MKQKTRILISCLAFAFCAQACSDDSSGNATPSGTSLKIGDACTPSDTCPDDSKCIDGVCTANEDEDACAKCKGECKNGKCVDDDGSEKCGGKKCAENQKCRNDVCVDLCGGEICKEGWKCIMNECTEMVEQPCGDVTCTQGQVCHNEICHDEGDCGGLACTEDEQCHNDVCHLEGDCGGLACTEDESCYRDMECRPYGDCDGVACLDDEICADGCRPTGDCNGAACFDNEFCFRGETCQEKELCGEVYCDVNFECVDDVCQPSELCTETDEERCNGVCCAWNEFCGQRTECCPVAEACGQDCCRTGEVCIDEMCHIACDEGIERCTLLDGTEVCCAAGQICSSRQCFTPTTSCIDNYMCDNGQYCDPEMKTCLPQPTGEVCMATPKGGEVQPTLLWYWGEVPPDPFPNHEQVMSSPMVGDINNDTIPEVAFN